MNTSLHYLLQMSMSKNCINLMIINTLQGTTEMLFPCAEILTITSLQIYCRVWCEIILETDRHLAKLWIWKLIATTICNLLKYTTHQQTPPSLRATLVLFLTNISQIRNVWQSLAYSLLSTVVSPPSEYLWKTLTYWSPECLTAPPHSEHRWTKCANNYRLRPYNFFCLKFWDH